MSDRSYDVVVYGATSFVGQIITRYMNNRFGSKGRLRWAVAGRSETKLKSVLEELGCPEIPHLVADSADEAAVKKLCEATKVLATTVGPYALYGSKVVAECAAAGTHYCDLSGEVQWIRRMIDEHQQTAEASGARIVNCCGFDSVPSDIGVWYTQKQAQERFGAPCVDIRMRVKAWRGEASGGTVASLLNVVAEASQDPQLRKQMTNPYSLAPKQMRSGVRQPPLNSAQNDDFHKAWVAPFIMAAINTRIVHRSHALMGRPWGEEFVYQEGMMTGKGLKGRLRASSTSVGMVAFMAASAVKPSRWFLQKFVLPEPGEGPSEEAQLAGFYDIRFVGKTANGDTIHTKVTGDQDPGYGSTAKMFGEAAASLALDKAITGGGLWTPATALGESYFKRLKEHAGLTFEVIEE